MSTPVSARPPLEVESIPADGHATAVDTSASTQSLPLEARRPARATRRPGIKRRPLLIVLGITVLVCLVGLTIAYRYWYESTYFVMTDNAQVTGDLVQVGSLNAGRIVATRVDVGDRVQKDQVVATVAIPQSVAMPFGAQPKLDVTGTTDSLVDVRAPLTGVVAARTGFDGSTVSAGQPIVALVDPSRVWVKANIDESKVWKVQPGQPVEVHIDALGRSFDGRVEAVTPASAATFSLLPSQNTSGNFIKVAQYVPVKIVVDSRDAVLPLGTSAEIRIQVLEPSGGVPWQP